MCTVIRPPTLCTYGTPEFQQGAGVRLAVLFGPTKHSGQSPPQDHPRLFVMPTMPRSSGRPCPPVLSLPATISYLGRFWSAAGLISIGRVVELLMPSRAAQISLAFCSSVNIVENFGSRNAASFIYEHLSPNDVTPSIISDLTLWSQRLKKMNQKIHARLWQDFFSSRLT